MLKPIRLAGVIGLATFLAGCGTSEPASTSVAPGTVSPLPGKVTVTFHVKEMSERLRLL